MMSLSHWPKVEVTLVAGSLSHRPEVKGVAYLLQKQVKQVYNDQPLGILALGKIGGCYGSLVSVVSRVPGYLEMVPGYPDVVPGYLGGVLWSPGWGS